MLYVDLLDGWHHDGQNLLNANAARRNLSNDDGLPLLAATDRNDYTFKNLGSRLLFFDDPLVNTNGVADG